MERRAFCRLAALAAVSRVFATAGEPVDGAQAALQQFPDAAALDYGQFCALPPEKRVFYRISGNRIVRTALNDSSWHVTPDNFTMPSGPIGGGLWDGVPLQAPIPGSAGVGPFQPTWDSLLQYEAPEWYRDAKFGVWAHWSPQCVPEDGDWYARFMYKQGSKQYRFHTEHYGHPSRFGYKDLCAQWTLLNWDPDALITLYKRAGARLFMALANHHDGFDAWNSKHHPWNSSAIGPHRDVVGSWAQAARKQGLRFGVSVHQARNWWWFQTAHATDRNGALASVQYDGDLTLAQASDKWWQGVDPQRLYGVKHPADALPDPSYVKNFYDRTRDLIDQHDLDLLYFDDSLLPLGWAGMNIGAYFYNRNLETHAGRMEAVLNVKDLPTNLAKAAVGDCEGGLSADIMPYPWQSETCIGRWHYMRDLYEKPGKYGGYLPPRDIIHWLVDTVSKNGTFILNIPGRPDGTIDSKEVEVLDGIAAWLQANGEAIFETRPWTIFGEGPHAVTPGSFEGDSIRRVGAKDIRYTRNKANTCVYAIVLGWPSAPVSMRALGYSSPTSPGRIRHVELLGTDESVVWTQHDHELRVELPRNFVPIANYAAAFKLTFV